MYIIKNMVTKVTFLEGEMNKMGMEVFATRIKKLRTDSGMTVRMMGTVLNVSHAAIVYYENCKREPTLSVLKAYAKHFNVTVDYLIGMDGE
jgi:transcriptional regulator with XRE-family HTH domain